MAQASKAILPKDAGGPWGQRIGVTVAGSLDWGLRVGAYVTKRVSSSDWNRYSLVVMNWFVFSTIDLGFQANFVHGHRDDSSSSTFNPVSIDATIEFRGQQVSTLSPSYLAHIACRSHAIFRPSTLSPWE